MTKEHGNMGTKSHKVQDAHLEQHTDELAQQIPDQPTRPNINPNQHRSSKRTKGPGKGDADIAS